MIGELRKKPQCQIQWFEIHVLHEALSSLSKYEVLCESIKAIKAKIENNWSNDVFKIDYVDILDEFNIDDQALFYKFNVDLAIDREKILAYNRKQNELELSEENKNNTLSLLNAISNLVSISEEVINRLSIKITITPYNIGKIFEIITLIKNKPIFQPTWFDNGIVCNALQNIDKYQNICNEINAIVNKISENVAGQLAEAVILHYEK